jgi:hypothetical protein
VPFARGREALRFIFRSSSETLESLTKLLLSCRCSAPRPIPQRKCATYPITLQWFAEKRAH